MSEEEIETLLKGNTLRVYWYLLSKPETLIGARQTQRALRFSSPALAVYHLDKLSDLGLVKTVNIGVLKQFVRFGTFMIPRYFLYATMFTTLLIFFLTQLKTLNFYSMFALVSILLAVGVTWFETLMTWKQRP
jgi:hypothetical protein